MEKSNKALLLALNKTNLKQEGLANVYKVVLSKPSRQTLATPDPESSMTFTVLGKDPSIRVSSSLHHIVQVPLLHRLGKCQAYLAWPIATEYHQVENLVTIIRGQGMCIFHFQNASSEHASDRVSTQ